MGKIDVWIMHKRKVVQVTDFPGVPVEICGYVSPEAAQAATERGGATISEIGFNRDDWKMFDDYQEAEKWAAEKAKELGYQVDTNYQDDEYFDEWDDEDDDEDWDLFDTAEIDCEDDPDCYDYDDEE